VRACSDFGQARLLATRERAYSPPAPRVKADPLPRRPALNRRVLRAQYLPGSGNESAPLAAELIASGPPLRLARSAMSNEGCGATERAGVGAGAGGDPRQGFRAEDRATTSDQSADGGSRSFSNVASSGDDRAYECAYGLVSAGRFSPQFVAASNWPVCSIFQLGAAAFSSFGRTFNPKDGGSSPPPTHAKLLQT
jgi:hypothetical protein